LEIVPDNYDGYISYENEHERLERLHRKQLYEEELENENMEDYT
jgi:hypothetical protein